MTSGAHFKRVFINWPRKMKNFYILVCSTKERPTLKSVYRWSWNENQVWESKISWSVGNFAEKDGCGLSYKILIVSPMISRLRRFSMLPTTQKISKHQFLNIDSTKIWKCYRLKAHTTREMYGSIIKYL